MFHKIIDDSTYEVFKSSISSISIKVFGMAAAFGMSVFLGRTIGPSGLGKINLANQIVTVCSVFAMFGMQHVLIKTIAIANKKKDHSVIRNSIGTSLLFNGVISLVLSGLGILLAKNISVNFFEDADLTTPLRIFFISLFPLTIGRVLIYSLNGIKKVWQSNLLDQVLSVILITLALFVGWFFDYYPNVNHVAYLYLASRILVLLCTAIFWKGHFEFSFGLNRSSELNGMLKMAFPLLLVSSTSIIASNADTIMLGWLSDSSSVGLYSVAARIALLTSFILQVTNSAISPRLAHMFADNKLSETQRMVKQVSRALTFVAVIFLLIVFFAGRPILSLWGTEFISAYLPLTILCIGQFFNISTGCAGLLLVMCGHEKILGKISLVSLLVNLCLNMILIKNYGIVGAAIATALVITLGNIAKVILAKRKTGVMSIPFSF